ncbi:indole-3-glycerol-phosphate synthase [Marinivivus vitaminiproducens]|uniref:indole-3-glycerol-phosphate synthase n=1 Tax=Marinivivus vitaminiproducens TaxID=3035935 RepID=UPI00279C061B|nr:hypothetical protein P4R82_11640 [Geminicoccaceae bacterium SCSIO 64248]
MPHEFITRLEAAPRPLIMEIKKRSASGRDLFAGREVADLVAAYEEAGAPCLSVVTGRWFGGDERLFTAVRELTDLPLLKKDFITTRRQLDRAADAGAAAVLLTAALLPGDVLGRLIAEARERALVAFVEVAGPTEADRVEPAEGVVVAVNNKDIQERERGAAHIARSAALLPGLRAAGHECVVSASGIAEPAVGAALVGAGYDGLLIGTALLEAPAPADWVAGFDRALQVEAA